ncbi:PAS domain S-box protein [Natrarchaeobius oligotrophus]|uniref:histidine kinase n=1 Tax=Natrarchaeobius chitinivorans TaxID=1679083 RepID=A0A3N6NHS1_NATCH|nr:PAS domain S-box protein [Natrarchaeobius chitinivorans]RQG98662.1 PAS domain S-box protein [Natrarchaeobius chitinivorans]
MADRARTADGERGPDVDGDVARRCYRAVSESVDDGVFRLDADGRVVDVNDAFLERTGYDRDALVGGPLSTFVDDRGVDRFEREVVARREDDADGTIGLSIETADSDRLHLEIRTTVLTTDGEFRGTLNVVQSAREPAADRGDVPSLWETTESITSVIDEADVGVFVLDESFDVVWIDETAETFFGIDGSEVVGRSKRAVIDETIRDRVADPDAFAETVLATYDDNTYVERFECRITAGQSRRERWLEHRSKPIESGRYAGGRVELYYDVTDRKESERARRASERRFRSLVDAVEEYAIFMLDADGTVVSWNEGAERIKGYEPEEVIGEHVSLFYTSEDRDAGVPERNLTKARETGAVEDEGWRVRADGSTFWANATITAIREDGELQGYAKVTRDMTDRREREQKLQRERDLIERILQTSPVGIAVVNRDGSTSRANERMAELLDVSPEDVSEYGAGQRDMFDEAGDLLSIDQRPAGRVFESGEPLHDQEILIDPPGGQQRWLSINATPIADDEGTPEQVVVTATDITDLKELAERRKRELEEREKELAIVRLATNLLEPGDQPVDELLQELVEQLPRSFQYPSSTVARVSIGEHEATSDEYEPLDRSLTALTRTANGTLIAIDVGCLESAPTPDSDPFLPEEQELIDTLATLVKFHFERQEYVEELRAETRRLEQFAYAASHDLQEPLRMISSYLQLLERRYGDRLDDDGREFLGFAIDGAERMRSMIDGLLAYSRVETRGDPFETVDLDDVLDDVRADLEVRIVESNAEITADSLPRVEGDASQLRQVFQNLLDNAIEYSGDEPPRIHVSADGRDDEWVISVRDEGIGIDPDDAERIFDVFERLHTHDEHPGTGIGLALCERIVERHGGEIWIDAEPGEGTTVSFTLPAADE